MTHMKLATLDGELAAWCTANVSTLVAYRGTFVAVHLIHGVVAAAPDFERLAKHVQFLAYDVIEEVSLLEVERILTRGSRPTLVMPAPSEAGEEGDDSPRQAWLPDDPDSRRTELDWPC